MTDPPQANVGLGAVLALFGLFAGFTLSGLTNNESKVEQARMAEQLKAINKQLEVLTSNVYSAVDASRDFSVRDDRINLLAKRVDGHQNDITELFRLVSELKR